MGGAWRARLSAFLLAAVPGGFFAGCASSSGSAFLAANYDPARVQRVAVVDFQDYPGYSGSGALVSGIFQSYALALGYVFVERTQVEQVLQEQNFQASGVVDPATEVRLGRLLGASDLIVGNLTDFAQASEQTVLENMPVVNSQPIIAPVQGQMAVVGYNTTMIPQSIPVTQTLPARVGLALRMVDVRTGAVLWSASGDASASDVSAAAQAASSKIARLLRGKIDAASVKRPAAART